MGKFSFSFGYPVSSSKSRREGGYKWEGVRKERKDAGISRDRKMNDKYLRLPNDYEQKESGLYKFAIFVKILGTRIYCAFLYKCRDPFPWEGPQNCCNIMQQNLKIKKN